MILTEDSANSSIAHAMNLTIVECASIEQFKNRLNMQFITHIAIRMCPALEVCALSTIMDGNKFANLLAHL